MNEFNQSSPFPLFNETKPAVKHNYGKRLFDIFFSLMAILICFPIFIFIALVVRFSSKGKVVYSHQRIGRGGKPFQCYKFRSMYADADVRLKELLARNPDLQEEWKNTHKLKNDPRITRIGKFLRKTSLDEFPQFFNVLKGDMSVVGPRPVVLAEVVNHLNTKAPKILSIRPGLTCLWQVSGRNDTTYEKRVQLDEKYVDDHSLLLDIKLIAMTIPKMIFSKGAY